jgi:hypothetical protein
MTLSARIRIRVSIPQNLSAQATLIIRDAFPGNAIPEQLIDPKAALFLRKYVPRPNLEMGMMGCGMTMMGAPTVVGDLSGAVRLPVHDLCFW